MVGSLLSFWDSKFHQGPNVKPSRGVWLHLRDCLAWFSSSETSLPLSSAISVGRLRDRKRPPSRDPKRSRKEKDVWSGANRKNTGFFREIHGNPLLFKSKKNRWNAEDAWFCHQLDGWSMSWCWLIEHLLNLINQLYTWKCGNITEFANFQLFFLDNETEKLKKGKLTKVPLQCSKNPCN